MHKAKEFTWTRITECFLTLGILLAIQICPCHAQFISPIPQELQKFSLGGLNGVSVVVAPFEASADGSSLRQDLVQTDTEIRLRKAGINVVDTQQFEKQLGEVAILYIELQFIKEDTIDRITYSISVSAIQTAKPLRDSPSTPPKFQAETWIDGVFGHVTSENMATIRQSVGDIVDKFTNDYLASNPKLGAKATDITPHTARSNNALHLTPYSRI
jgi:hypothetical protein